MADPLPAQLQQSQQVQQQAQQLQQMQSEIDRLLHERAEWQRERLAMQQQLQAARADMLRVQQEAAARETALRERMEHEQHEMRTLWDADRAQLAQLRTELGERGDALAPGPAPSAASCARLQEELRLTKALLLLKNVEVDVRLQAGEAAGADAPGPAPAGTEPRELIRLHGSPQVLQELMHLRKKIKVRPAPALAPLRLPTLPAAPAHAARSCCSTAAMCCAQRQQCCGRPFRRRWIGCLELLNGRCKRSVRALARPRVRVRMRMRLTLCALRCATARQRQSLQARLDKLVQLFN